MANKIKECKSWIETFPENNISVIDSVRRLTGDRTKKLCVQKTEFVIEDNPMILERLIASLDARLDTSNKLVAKRMKKCLSDFYTTLFEKKLITEFLASYMYKPATLSNIFITRHAFNVACESNGFIKDIQFKYIKAKGKIPNEEEIDKVVKDIIEKSSTEELLISNWHRNPTYVLEKLWFKRDLIDKISRSELKISDIICEQPLILLGIV